MRSILIPLVFLGLLSCEKGQLIFNTEEEFEMYLNDADNGFIESSESADFKYETKLIPPMKDDTNSQISIQLRIHRKDNGSVLKFENVQMQEISNREAYLSFEIAKDVFLETEDKTIPVSFHHYERNYGLKPSLDLYFTFEKVDDSKDIKFVYRDQLFHQGLVSIEYNKQLLKSCDVRKK